MWRPRSLRVRFTLRALFVFITLFMLWGGYHTNRGWKERAAENVLTKRGASCQYAKQTIEGDLIQRVAAVYGRVVQILWRERAVTYVSLDASLDAEVVEALASLPNLKSLWISPEKPNAEQGQLMKDGKALKPKEAVPNGALERILGACPLRQLAISGWVLSDSDCQRISAKANLPDQPRSDRQGDPQSHGRRALDRLAARKPGPGAALFPSARVGGEAGIAPPNRLLSL